MAAAAGLRVFLPLLLLGSAARLGWLPLSDGFEWLSSGVGLGALGAATVLEIGAYYIPWIDNLLDLVQLVDIGSFDGEGDAVVADRSERHRKMVEGGSEIVHHVAEHERCLVVGLLDHVEGCGHRKFACKVTISHRLGSLRSMRRSVTA